MKTKSKRDLNKLKEKLKADSAKGEKWKVEEKHPGSMRILRIVNSKMSLDACVSVFDGQKYPTRKAIQSICDKLNAPPRPPA